MGWPRPAKDAFDAGQANFILGDEVNLSCAVGEPRHDLIKSVGSESVFHRAGWAGLVASAGVVITGVTVPRCLILGVQEPIYQRRDLRFCVRVSDSKDHKQTLAVGCRNSAVLSLDALVWCYGYSGGNRRSQLLFAHWL
jgi:hypothetical protein